MEFSLDPIIYFYIHSLVIIGFSAVVFMCLGVWIGHLTWAKFKRRARAYQEECDLLRHEIAALKRRIGEETAGPPPLVLINEDAPVPEAADDDPPLPGFDLHASASVLSETREPARNFTDPIRKEPSRETLAAVVIGPAGAVHHTLEPVAPPDSITAFPDTSVDAGQKAVSVADEPPAPIIASSAVHAAPPAKHRRHKANDQGGGEVEPPVRITDAGAEKRSSAPQHAPEIAPSLVADASTVFATELSEGEAICDPVLGILLHSKPEQWDDLTLLRGMGEVLQQRLHDQGVHTFKQIAYWTDVNVEAFSAKIEARDRIQREHWVSQARDMHFLKYGEKLA
ncbi:MAG: ribosomal protein [Verrucomicrobiaceae bacterium]|nr:ribosomal protein [Verrucomicrobiaceae bacterium]